MIGEWISVKDRLPEKEEGLYLIFANGHVRTAFYSNSLFEHSILDSNWQNITLNNDRGGFHNWDPSIEDEVELENVTHWMPLPDPPEKD